MAIATLPTTESRQEIVFTEDPDVTPKNGCKGWIPVDAADVSKGADVLEVRPLNIAERTTALDIDGIHAGMLRRVLKGVTKVNGMTGAKEIKSWVERCPSSAVFLLGCYIASVTSGDDPQKSQSAFYREGGDESGSD